MTKLLKPFDYFFILKPVMFFPVWTIFLSGYYVQNKAAAVESMPGDTTFLWTGLLLTLLTGGLVALNQVMDRRALSKDANLLLIADGFLTPKAAFTEAVILLVIALLGGFLISIETGLTFMILLIFAGYLFNFTPFSWKDEPILNVLTYGLASFLIYAAGWLCHGVISSALFLHAVPYVLIAMAVYLLTTTPTTKPAEGDVKVTFAVKYGTAATIYISLLFEVMSLVIAFILYDEIVFYPALFSLPFFIWAGLKTTPHEVVRAVKYCLLLLTLTVCVKWILTYANTNYFIVLLVIYFFSKFYYRFRFGINYPNLSV
jgi:4-hydroxybenzoate polyprenyltransferase